MRSPKRMNEKCEKIYEILKPWPLTPRTFTLMTHGRYDIVYFIIHLNTNIGEVGRH